MDWHIPVMDKSEYAGKGKEKQKLPCMKKANTERFHQHEEPLNVKAIRFLSRAEASKKGFFLFGGGGVELVPRWEVVDGSTKTSTYNSSSTSSSLKFTQSIL